MHAYTNAEHEMIVKYLKELTVFTQASVKTLNAQHVFLQTSSKSYAYTCVPALIQYTH